MKHIIISFIFLFCFCTGSKAQCPTGANALASANPICKGDTIQLNTALLGGCSSYTVTSIPFAAVAGAGTNVTLGDNQISGPLPIGFTFNFFCLDYTQFYISSNGFITFNAASGDGCCNGQLLPNAATPNNLIALAWEDFDPSAGGTINYFTTGTAPNRRLIVNYNNVPHAGGGGGPLTAQLILYETTNVIEIHTTGQTSDGGLHTMGIEDASGSTGFSAPGRNAANWSTLNDGKRFSPGQPPASGLFTYSWTPPTGLSNPNISNPQAFPAQTTTYVITVSDTACPSVSDTLVILVDTTNISVSILTPDTSICAGSVAISTSATGASSYLWNPSTGLNCATCPNPVATSTVNTTYYVTVVSAMGFCTATDSIAITVSNLAVYTASASDSTICLGDSVQLSIIGNNFTENFDPINSLQWDSISGGAPSQNCGSVSGNALFFDGALQRSAATSALNVIGGGTVDFYLKIGNSTPASCETVDPGEDIVLEYSTNGGNTWNVMNTYVSGTYGTFTLASEPIPPAAQTVATMFQWRQLTHSGTCCDHWAIDDVLISISSPSSLTFNWSPSTGLSCTTCANPMAAPSQTTTYTVTLTDSICTATDTITIFVDTNTVSVSVLTADTFICAGGNVPITISSSGATSYLWSPAWGLSCTTCPNPVATPTFSTTYTVTAFASFGACNTKDSITITVSSLTQITPIAAPNPACGAGDSVQLNVAITGTPPSGYCLPVYSTDCSSGDFVDNFTFNTIVNNGTGCNGTPPNNYTYFSSMNTTVIPGNTYNMSMQSGLSWDQGFGVWIDYNRDGDFNDPGEFVYASPTSATTPFNTTVAIPLNAVPGTTRLRVLCRYNTTITAGDACGTTFSFGECEDYNVLISGPQANFTYSWVPAGNLSNPNIANPIATPTGTTTYTVTVTDTVAGCTLSGAVTVTVNPLPAAAVSPSSSTICFGQNTTLTASGGTSYSWLPGGQTSTAIIVAQSNTYSVIVTDQFGCSAVATASVTVFSSPTITASGGTTICAGQSATLTASGGASYSWLPSGQTFNPIVVNPPVTTSYTVIGTAANGCTNSAVVTVSVIPTPAAGFTYTLSGYTASFTNTSTGATSWNWNFGDGNTSVSQNPVYTYTAAGTYTVCLVASNACGSDSTCTVITVVSVKEYTGSTGMTVYPNPASQSITVSIAVPVLEGGALSMLNMLGEEIRRMELPGTVQTPAKFTLDISDAPPGVYLFRIILPDKVLMQMVTVNR